jgi:hypothetical protein
MRTKIIVYLLSLVASFIIAFACMSNFLYIRKHTHPIIGREFTIYVDDSFSNKQKLYIKDAIREWELALNNKIKINTIEIRISQNNLALHGTDNKITIYNATSFNKQRNIILYESPGSKETLGMTQITSLDIWVLHVDYFYKIIVHELGHILIQGPGNYDHSDNNNSIMYPFLLDQEQHITEDDVLKVKIFFKMD